MPFYKDLAYPNITNLHRKDAVMFYIVIEYAFGPKSKT